MVGLDGGGQNTNSDADSYLFWGIGKSGETQPGLGQVGRASWLGPPAGLVINPGVLSGTDAT